MARTVIGYVLAGHPPRRRAVYRDEGPSRGRLGERGGSEPLSRLGAQTLPSRILVGGSATGAGSIERRQATDAQRAAWASEHVAPSLLHRAPGVPSPARPRNTAAESRARGAARAGFTPGTVKPYLAARQPAPVTPPSPLEEGAMVAPAPPASNGHANIPDSIPGGKAVDVVTPCDDCSHAPICRIRPLFEDLVVDARFADAQVDPAIRIVAVSIECDYFLERPTSAVRETPVEVARRLSPVDALVTNAREGVTSDVAPNDAADTASRAARQPERAEAGVANGRPPYVDRLLRALVELKGDRRAAADMLGIQLDSLVGTLSRIRTRTDLTLAERSVIASSRRSPGAPS